VTVTGTPGQYPARYCGRDFTPAELLEIRSLAATLPTRRAIADAICDALGWHAPGGRRKDMTARVALGRMAADGQTRGRGKLDRRHEHALPIKDIYLYPLHRRWRQILTTPPAQ
jgi:hypothetical protein